MRPSPTLTPVQERSALKTALANPESLCTWLAESGRRWLVFDSVDLVKSLPWPDGVQALMEIIACYRDHRRAIPVGRAAGAMKDEHLEIEELDRCIRHLIGQASERDPNWRLENPAL